VDLLRRALIDEKLVQSFSGVRAILGQGPGLSDEHEALACAYGYIYARMLPAGKSTLLLGRDPRPTGAALGRALVRGFLAGAAEAESRLRVIDLGIITTPLAETAVRSLESDGGVIVTASHNPIEHNGFKFLTGVRELGGPPELGRDLKSRPSSGVAAPPGALLSAPAMEQVIAQVAALADGDCAGYEKLIATTTPEMVDKCLTGHDNESPRIKAERAYLDVIGRDWGIAPHCLKPLTLGPALLDPNGGAGCGIDARVLEHFGVRVIEINAELGYPEHGIDTDGIDPASGRHMLLRVARAAARERAHFGVAFDYDADRGNLVLPGHDESTIIPPQQVAAFNIALALARRRLQGVRNGNLAVVISDATSLASERVAAAFDAKVFHVETGEINVVSKMHSLRREGYDVPVGVEGANGGTIFETSTCRDGLQAALSAALAESQPQVAREWMRIASQVNGGRFDPSRPLSLQELISSVPVNPNVFLKLSSPPISHGELKRRMEDYFTKSVWPKLSSRFEAFEFQNFEGTRQVSERTGDESGAWRVHLRADGRRAFVFVRGSRTEAGVWRMIVDADDASDFAVLEPAARAMFEAAARLMV
jgi:phosphoglucomutase